MTGNSVVREPILLSTMSGAVGVMKHDLEPMKIEIRQQWRNHTTIGFRNQNAANRQRPITLVSQATGFANSERLATLKMCNKAETGSQKLRLTSSSHRDSHRKLPHACANLTSW
ncbi:MAG: hypothetical protein COA78_26525 [Blastopirellula sp.]|nr:MAG: hypothetical protein COA78_26525 [Blastopirellula sp.]